MECNYHKCPVQATQKITFTSGMEARYCTVHAAIFDPGVIEEQEALDTSPMVQSMRSKKLVRIIEDNEVMIYMNTSVLYSSDELPEWFKPLQPIIEDWTFSSMIINLEDVHYKISVEEDAQGGHA